MATGADTMLWTLEKENPEGEDVVAPVVDDEVPKLPNPWKPENGDGLAG